MKLLRKKLHEYLRIRRAMGFKLTHHEYELTRFITFLKNKKQSFITVEMAMLWSNRSKTAKQVTRSKQLSMIRGFAIYLKAEDDRTEIPATNLIPNPELKRSRPYIYTEAEIGQLIKATEIIKAKFKRRTYETLFSLLAATGLRIGEAIRLDINDFNEREGLLVIRESKFGKSREVMLHKTAVKALKKYTDERARHFKKLETDAFFVSRARKRLIYENVNREFIKLLGPAGLKVEKPNRPRLHDLRHTFAIQTLIDCYKSGENSEKRLYELSTYLGHSSPESTYWYLTAVPDLLNEAIKCLEKMKRSL